MILKKGRLYSTPNYTVYVLSISINQAFVELINHPSAKEPFFITKVLGSNVREFRQIRL